MSFLSPSESSKCFIDGISGTIFANEFNIKDTTDTEIQAICDFEKSRFEFNSQYSGKKKIETNRYLLCLEELVCREHNSKNIITLEEFKLDYEPYWDLFSGKYNFSMEREDVVWTLSRISKDILKKFKETPNIDAMLLCAKAHIKQADCEYAEVIVFRNKYADKLISNALDLINKAAYKAISLSRKEQISCMLKIAECYILIGEIYMRVTSESGLSIEFFRHSIYEQAAELFENARSLFVTVGYESLENNDIENFLDLLYSECEIITKGRYIKNKTVKEINKTVSELIAFVESNMYRIVQSQTICSQYAALCATKANVISNEIPTLGHKSERDLYPWSTVYTKTENYHLYDTLKNMDFWCDKSVFLCKYLFSINPTPGNIERLITSAKSRISILNYYEYRSLETIEKAGTKNVGGLTEIDVSKDDITKDRQDQEKRKIPFLLIFCEALKHPNAPNIDKSIGLYLIVANKLFRLYRDFEGDNCWLSYTEELLSFEQGMVECIMYALDNRQSFSFYLLTPKLRRFKFDDFRFYTNKQVYGKLEQEYNIVLDENFSMYNSTYSEWFFDWIL